MEKARKRTSNYTLREKELLVSLLEKYLHIIENKKTNAVVNKQKGECWEKLACEYNANETSGLRTDAQLKSAYEQMKKIAKQHTAEDKVEIMKTEGGIFFPKLTSIDEKILSLIKENYFNIDNRLDCNYTGTIVSKMSNSSTSHCEDEENIIVYEEMSEHNDQEFIAPLNNDNDPNNISNQQLITNTWENEEKCEPYAKQRKVHVQALTNTGKKIKNIHTNELNNTKQEILQLKLNILKTIEQSEIENLKGKKHDKGNYKSKGITRSTE